jgi:hypothetical protein
MQPPPVAAAEIADLMRRIRQLHLQRPRDPHEEAAVLALKAELLGRIAHQRAQEWGPCESTTAVRKIAREAHAIAENALRLTQTCQEKPPPF